jgi:23S rRNA pseudouridine955/2504/2580 synthase
MKTFIADKNRKLSKLALYHLEDLSYSTLMKLLRAKDVKVNGKRVSQDVTLNVGDKVELYYVPKTIDKYQTIFLDENVLVLDKKSGFTSESVYQTVCEDYPTAKFIHRLDRNTAGLMIFALNDMAEQELLKGFKERLFDKIYTATVFGKMPKQEDVLSAYLLKDSEASLVKIFDKQVKGALPIKTGYKVIKEDVSTSVVKVKLYTGKTHQIRAHLAHIGNFIVGDGKYGDNAFNQKMGVKSQMLFASELTLKFNDNSKLFYLNGKTFISKQV